MNERFAAIELQANRRGQIGLNFTQFDQTSEAIRRVSMTKHALKLVQDNLISTLLSECF